MIRKSQKKDFPEPTLPPSGDTSDDVQFAQESRLAVVIVSAGGEIKY